MRLIIIIITIINNNRNTQSLVFGYLAIVTLQLPCRKEKCEINKAKWYFRDDFSN